MMQPLEKVGLAVLVVPLLLAISTLSMLWSAYVGTILWGWFVTPVFYWSAPTPSIWALFGLALFLRLPFAKYEPDSNERPLAENIGRVVGAITFGLLTPAMALLFGWFASQFM